MLTRRMRAALERLLVEGSEAELAQVQEQVRALAERVEELAEESRSGREAAAAELAALREEHAGSVLGLQRRLGRLESGERGREGEDPGAGSAADPGGKPPEPASPRRKHPELVTREPAPDDGEVFGAAWPLVDEWRRLRAGHGAGGEGLAWLIAEERVLELEVALLEEHGLTLPPDEEPVRGLWRESPAGVAEAGARRRAAAAREGGAPEDAEAGAVAGAVVGVGKGRRPPGHVPGTGVMGEPGQEGWRVLRGDADTGCVVRLLSASNQRTLKGAPRPWPTKGIEPRSPRGTSKREFCCGT